MTELQRIEELERQVKLIQKCLLDSGKASTQQTARVDDTSNKVEQITPYKASKTAYIGDTEVVFLDVPQGNLSVFSDKPINYSVERINNAISVTFDALDEVTEVTISIQ